MARTPTSLPYLLLRANFMLPGLDLRRDKLNSQFIVTKISILHAGGRSFFIFQTSRECWKAILKSPRSRPLISAIGGWGSKCHILCLMYWIWNFWENLKIHAGGDDKQRIQFAPPYLFCVLCGHPTLTSIIAVYRDSSDFYRSWRIKYLLAVDRKAAYTGHGNNCKQPKECN